ncbi:biotin-dependent carboxyltransferase family protein [Chromobacterium haemolyticum]|uniref:5-oxoprolinase subunit C family protein n=1 Tax=Chromobacterium haemolyticum TaxID=394935 RepID=UPI0005BCDF1C|nr:biotin-dependent carboxyltransferase family protein [Chromobacterium haemolyticum]
MIEVTQAGIQSTVQDLGRRGLRHLGVAQSGALDAPALIMANRLLGNAADAAGIEVALGPFGVRFLRDGWFALMGADFGAELDGEPVWSGWRYPARAGQHLLLRGCRHGMRAYLALAGGIDAPLALGARATDLQAGFGGWMGRALEAGDQLPLGPALALSGRLGRRNLGWTPLLRALPGPEWQQFSRAARQAFSEGEWTVSAQSNRMGYRLQGEALAREAAGDLPSHGVLPGVVQAPPGGQPIVLLADAQATGGYPRIACVIEADLWKLAQARPGAKMRFEMVDAQQAAAARLRLRQWLQGQDWSQACRSI